MARARPKKRERDGAGGGQLPLPAPPPQAPPRAATRLLPMPLQLGDRFVDATGEWEIVGHPYTGRVRDKAARRRSRSTTLHRDLTVKFEGRIDAR